MTTIYTLKLEHNKYYIGRSKIPKQRIIKHFQEEGCEWTKQYKPISILSHITGDEFDEEKYTLIAMDKYGIDNVRGGSYCKIILTPYDKDKALQTIRSITDKCYKCGMKGHFVKECFINNSICVVCNGSRRDPWGGGHYGSCECLCLRCGYVDENRNRNKCCHECDKCKEIIKNNEEHDCWCSDCIGSEKCLVHRGNICCITGMPGCGVNNIICNQCKA